MNARPNRGVWWLAAGLAALYTGLVLVDARRMLWFDELFTYYISVAPTLHQAFDLMRKFDLNPPPVYLLTRASVFVFGDNLLATRLPSIVEFFVGSLMLFLYMRRKAGYSYATLTLLVVWYGPVFRYATEARPYALIFMGFTCLLYCFDTAISAERRTAALWGAAISNAAMLSAHVLAPLSLMPFLAVEALRFSKRRRPDYPLWLALVLPLGCAVLYLPLFQALNSLVFAPAYQASPAKMAVFFALPFLASGQGLCIAVLIAILIRTGAKKARVLEKNRWRPTDTVLFAVSMASPIVINLLLMRRNAPFWERYCLTTTVAIHIALVMFLALRLRFDRAAAYAAAIALAYPLLANSVVLPVIWGTGPERASALAQVRPDLPVVVAAGTTFLEMDHAEDPSTLSRLYYLRDKSAAIEFAHSTVYENLDEVKRTFPIHANVEQYADFVRANHQFLVLGAFDSPMDWILRKLAHDGASITLAGTYSIPYREKSLYLVTLRVPPEMSGTR